MQVLYTDEAVDVLLWRWARAVTASSPSLGISEFQSCERMWSNLLHFGWSFWEIISMFSAVLFFFYEFHTKLFEACTATYPPRGRQQSIYHVHLSAISLFYWVFFFFLISVAYSRISCLSRGLFSSTGISYDHI